MSTYDLEPLISDNKMGPIQRAVRLESVSDADRTASHVDRLESVSDAELARLTERIEALEAGLYLACIEVWKCRMSHSMG